MTNYTKNFQIHCSYAILAVSIKVHKYVNQVTPTMPLFEFSDESQAANRKVTYKYTRLVCMYVRLSLR